MYKIIGNKSIPTTGLLLSCYHYPLFV